MTPDKVETSIGTLEFTDGVPSRATADKAYDFMDTARAADAFLKGMPAASVAATSATYSAMSSGISLRTEISEGALCLT